MNFVASLPKEAHLFLQRFTMKLWGKILPALFIGTAAFAGSLNGDRLLQDEARLKQQITQSQRQLIALQKQKADRTVPVATTRFLLLRMRGVTTRPAGNGDIDAKIKVLQWNLKTERRDLTRVERRIQNQQSTGQFPQQFRVDLRDELLRQARETASDVGRFAARSAAEDARNAARENNRNHAKESDSSAKEMTPCPPHMH